MSLRSVSRRILNAETAASQILVQGVAKSRIHVRSLKICTDLSTATAPNVAVGFAISAQTISTGNVSVDGYGIVADIMGMAPGAIYRDEGTETLPLAVGGYAESLKFTCEAPTTGGITVVVQYESIER